MSLLAQLDHAGTRLPVRIARAPQPDGTAATIPAPVKGWNARDGFDSMDKEFAVLLDNWFPRQGYLELRRGNSAHATGVGSGVVDSLIAYQSDSAAKLLAAGGGSIYDASGAGAVGAALGSGFTSNRWQYTNFRTRAFLVNGVDAPQDFDGTTLAATSWSGTGLTITNLVYVHPFKQRLFFAEENAAHFWYGGLQAITGALTKFDLNDVHPEGGKLVAIGTLTIDGGAGIDDLVCFVMETGSVIIYAGTDPGDATAWSLVGVFKIGRPIGRRCLLEIGPDLAVITTDGYIPLRQFLATDRARQDLAISNNISQAVNEAVRDYGDHFGWQPIQYPEGQMLLFNVPVVEGAQAHQHVMNTNTAAWCRFTGINANCWAVHNDELYFGGNSGNVNKADSGKSDAGVNIETDGQTAWQYIGGRHRLKLFTMYRPLLSADTSVIVSMGLGVDFQEDITVQARATPADEGAEWDVAVWDVASWGGGLFVESGWQIAGALGYNASLRIKTSTVAQEIRWFATNVIHKPAGLVG